MKSIVFANIVFIMNSLRGLNLPLWISWRICTMYVLCRVFFPLVLFLFCFVLFCFVFLHVCILYALDVLGLCPLC